jgi:protein-S-isoprenylcysteine O-methyltransferase Ste14
MDKKSEMNKMEMKILKKKLTVRYLLIPLFLGLIILIPAGTLWFWQAYLYFAVLVVPMILGVFYFLIKDPKFLDRRTRAKEKEKQQKLISIFSTVVFLAGFILPGLDHRFGWSDVPINFVITADIIVLSGYLIIFAVFRQNSYASRIIEVEENQEVISTGLYGVVRHPMYLGVLVMFLPAPIALGSFWGLLPLSVLPLVLVLRILNEEKVLSANLPGYKEYCKTIRFRMIPFIW